MLLSTAVPTIVASLTANVKSSVAQWSGNNKSQALGFPVIPTYLPVLGHKVSPTSSAMAPNVVVLPEPVQQITPQPGIQSESNSISEIAIFNNKPAATIILQKGVMHETWKKYLYFALQASNILHVVEPHKVPPPINDPKVLIQHCTRFHDSVAQRLTPPDLNKISIFWIR